PVVSAAAGASGNPLVVADETGRLRVYMADFVAGASGAPRPVVAAAGTAAGALPLWAVPLDVPFRKHVKVVHVGSAVDGQGIYLATDDRVYRWKVLRLGASPLPITRPMSWPTPKPVHGIAADPTGQFLATLDADGVRV